MTFARRIRAAVRNIFATVAQSDDPRWSDYVPATASGVAVTQERALGISAFFDGVRQIAQTVASLPLIIYRRTSAGKERHVNHPVYMLLKRRPNAYMSAFQYWESAMLHLLLRGNHYALRITDNRGVVRELLPLNPARVVVSRSEDGDIRYAFTDEMGRQYEFSRSEVFHVAATSYDGICGMSVLHIARESLGGAIATEEHNLRFFSNGTHTGGVVSMTGALKDQAAIDRFRKSFAQAYSGLGNAHKVLVLENGAEFKELGVNPEDAQFLESRVFSVQEVARWLNMPPHKLKDLSRATYDNISSEQISYLTDTIRPWLVRVASAVNDQLLSGFGDAIFAEHKTEAILKTDLQTRYEAYSYALQNGFMSANEVRAAENLNSIGPQGDQYLVQLNMTTLDAIGGDREEKLV